MGQRIGGIPHDDPLLAEDLRRHRGAIVGPDRFVAAGGKPARRHGAEQRDGLVVHHDGGAARADDVGDLPGADPVSPA